MYEKIELILFDIHFVTINYVIYFQVYAQEYNYNFLKISRDAWVRYINRCGD